MKKLVGANLTNLKVVDGNKVIGTCDYDHAKIVLESECEGIDLDMFLNELAFDNMDDHILTFDVRIKRDFYWIDREWSDAYGSYSYESGAFDDMKFSTESDAVEYAKHHTYLLESNESFVIYERFDSGDDQFVDEVKALNTLWD